MADDRKYIYVKGEKIYVFDEIYKAYKKQVNHEAYLNKSDKKHKVYGYEDYKIDLNSIVDEDVEGGASAYLMQEIVEKQNAYRYLDSKPQTLTAKSHRPAYASDGDYFSKPNVEDVFEKVYAIMNEINPIKYPEFR